MVLEFVVGSSGVMTSEACSSMFVSFEANYSMAVASKASSPMVIVYFMVEASKAINSVIMVFEINLSM